ncbi:MAG TPA: hypothetical protein VHO06_11670 [Polyangia bacterium]|nr:hypothetical protein [Polyangia bacterium]
MRHALKALLVASLLTGAACGGGSDGKDLARFAGTWSSTAGTLVTTCDGQSSTSALSQTLTWSLGTSSDLIQTLPQTECIIHADVDGDTASELGTQTCTLATTDAYGEPVNETVSVTAYTFALSADGKTATENLSSTVLLTNNSTGVSGTCTVTETAGSYQKQ